MNAQFAMFSQKRFHECPSPTKKLQRYQMTLLMWILIRLMSLLWFTRPAGAAVGY